jgi:hypothetical protein
MNAVARNEEIEALHMEQIIPENDVSSQQSTSDVKSQEIDQENRKKDPRGAKNWNQSGS